MNAPFAAKPPAGPPDGRAVTLDITGMTCAACAARVETVVGRLPGVASVSVNLPLERADVLLGAGGSETAVVAAVENAGYGAALRKGTARERRLAAQEREATRLAEERQTLVLFALAALLSVPLVLPMLLGPLGLPWQPSPWTEFVLATPVQFIAGWRFYRGAFKAIRSGAATMDVLVALGTSAAYGFSAWMVLRHGDHAHGHLYFEGAAVIIALVLFGKVLETRARRGTTEAVRALVALRPQTARVERGGALVETGVDAVTEGERIIVHPGERFPVDGVVAEGRTEADESLVTGESLPVAKEPGDRIIAGALNGGGRIVMTATAVGEDTTLARITRMVEAAQTGKAPVQRLVDRISAVFVPVVIVVAILTFGVWMMLGADGERALVAAVSVLVIACPCALGLATPAALVAGTGAAARAGILVKDIEVLERAGEVDTVVLDKTGTLTLGRPEVAAIVPADGRARADVLALAGSLQAASEHPLGKAMVRAAQVEGLEAAPVEGFRAVIGEGVEGRVGGAVALAGRFGWVTGQGVDLDALADDARRLEAGGATVAALALGGRAVGLVALADALHPHARDAVAALKAQGRRAMMVTGDAEGPARRVAAAVGIAMADVRFGVRPAGKVEVIRELVTAGARPAMVGDGINDAPALAAATVGMAMGEGTDAAIETAQVALMRSDPKLVPGALVIARRTIAKIRQNLFWAFAYNVIGIPLAAMGFLTPALAGAAMALSSVSVVTNSLMLRNWKP
ncbi:heavy metal translocating P-type ATPase [Phreatobacter sp.]|uniref:heavy metal translocating P-type ATPase n=1 Tax=Phreatobacter sp. TaxID=1966341 RepID=UPI003F6FF1D9